MANEEVSCAHLMGQLYSLRNAFGRIIALLDADAKKAAITSVSEEKLILQQQLERWNDEKTSAFVTGALEEYRRIGLLMK
ncbi:hypothetical protein [Ochrobactrum quorumnocens]|uniref:Uncharacterized protein n=1 Tax=Ochrobactrum quorumnocens TaxID=271865 RepID=A0A5N1K268_9HYPH|nr:hypothetical protein [[Ochrobactrum] quorumnocens]KAA9368364.1 hypothetical protein F3W84_10785 [[Ochrobactrum] quorumnocens]